MSKRFNIVNKTITDTWTEYTYEYQNIEDYKELCGLLNHLQKNMDLLKEEKLDVEKDNEILRKILKTIL